MGKIILYKAQSDYNVLRILIDYIEAALKNLGRDVAVIDLLKPDKFKRIEEELSSECDFVFSFNNVGIEIKNFDKSMYDALEIPFVSMSVDHPISHFIRFYEPVNNVLNFCVDNTHVDFINEHFNGSKLCKFMPQAGCICDDKKILRMDERDIDVLFVGGFSKPEELKETWTPYSNSVKSALGDLCDDMISNEGESLKNAADKVFGKDWIYVNDERFDIIRNILINVEKYIKSYRRCELIKEIAASGIKMSCYGKREQYEKIGFKNNLIINDPVDFKETLNLMNRSKIVLNFLPHRPSGASERGFSAMLNGAVCLTDKNEYILKEFEEDKEIKFYSWNNLNQISSKIEMLLTDLGNTQKIADAGRKKCMENHTWEKRFNDIIKILNECTV
jgi:hypothetical protein